MCHQLPSRFARVRPSPSTLELLNAMLTYDPARRISAPEALRHRWLRSDLPLPTPTVATAVSLHRDRRPGTKERAIAAADAAARKRPALSPPPAQRSVNAPRLDTGSAEPNSDVGNATLQAVSGAEMAGAARIPSPTDITATAARQC